MKTNIIIYVLIIAFFTAPWVINFVKLTNCDFESNYKCEIIHGVGVVIPPTSWVTVWFESDS